MPRKTVIQLSIPQPCSQEWRGMQETGTGRYCGQCQKTVVDFTAMTDTELIQFLQKNSGTSCGRFLPAQLDRPVVAAASRTTWWTRIALGAALLLGINEEGHGQEMNKNIPAQAIHPTPNDKSKPDNHETAYVTPSDRKVQLKGQVVDDKGEPLINASVELLLKGVPVVNAVTDFDGNYLIVLAADRVKDSSAEIIFSFQGNTHRQSVLITAGDYTVNCMLHWQALEFSLRCTAGGIVHVTRWQRMKHRIKRTLHSR